MIEFDYERVNGRGFRVYAEFVDMYGKKCYVVESSGVEPGIWLQPEVKYVENPGVHLANLLLTPEDAADLAAVLIRASQEKRRESR